jgi:hypothetical protein
VIIYAVIAEIMFILAIYLLLFIRFKHSMMSVKVMYFEPIPIVYIRLVRFPLCYMDPGPYCTREVVQIACVIRFRVHTQFNVIFKLE